MNSGLSSRSLQFRQKKKVLNNYNLFWRSQVIIFICLFFYKNVQFITRSAKGRWWSDLCCSFRQWLNQLIAVSDRWGERLLFLSRNLSVWIVESARIRHWLSRLTCRTLIPELCLANHRILLFFVVFSNLLGSSHYSWASVVWGFSAPLPSAFLHSQSTSDITHSLL